MPSPQVLAVMDAWTALYESRPKTVQDSLDDLGAFLILDLARSAADALQAPPPADDAG